jgi:hypothetical protein
MHIKKVKGDLGVAFTIAALTEQGFNVALPITEHSKYDLIIEKNGILKTVQVRYTTPKNDVLHIKLRSCWNDKQGVHTTLREKGDYNILAAFNPITKIVYFINDDEFTNTSGINLRLSPPKNNQLNKIRLAKDYLLCQVLPPLSTVSHSK